MVEPATKVEEPIIPMRAMTPTAADLAALRTAFAQSSERPRADDSLKWQYLENRTGRMFVDVAEAQPGFAAIYATLPSSFHVGGARHLGLQSLDTLTAPEFRGRGLFLKLAKRTYERASSDGAALVYGFPNGSSAHGFFKKLDWKPLDPVPFLIRPLSLRFAAERLKLPARLVAATPNLPIWNSFRSLGRDGDIVELARADDRVSRLWQRFARRVDVAVERDAGYLQWRLFDKPAETYHTLVVERNGEFDALCSYTVKDKHGGRIGYVMELLCDPSLRGLHAASRLLGASVRGMVRERADSALAWCFSHSLTFPVFARHLFVPLPVRLRPIELHFGARAFDRSLAPLIERRSAWYISYLDSDTV